MKVGLLGVAHMHSHSYVKELMKAGITITGVYDHVLESSVRFAQQYDLNQVATTAELLATDCDTVLICSENVFHHELTLQACQAGKHVIVEKPMALSVADADSMIESAKQNKVKLMVAHPVRFTEPIQQLKKVIAEKKLGKVLAINASNHGKNPGGWFIRPELSGGGALIDHTVHISDVINYLFGLIPSEITAFISKSEATLPVEDIGLVNVRFTDETILSLDTSWNRPAGYPIWGDAILEIIFENGYSVVDGFGRKMRLFGDQSGQLEDFYFEEDMDHLMMESFIQAVDQDLPAPVTGEDGRFTVLITEKAFLAAKTETTIKVE